MMFFARGPKCGRRGAIGLGDPPGAAPSDLFSLSNDASAMPPNPIAHRLKKWRRVSVGSRSFDSKEFMAPDNSLLYVFNQPNAPETEAASARGWWPATPVRRTGQIRR